MGNRVKLILMLISLACLVAGFYFNYAWPAGYLLLFVANAEWFFAKKEAEYEAAVPEKMEDEFSAFDDIPKVAFHNGSRVYENKAFQKEFSIDNASDFEKLLSGLHSDTGEQSLPCNGKHYTVRRYDLNSDRYSHIFYFFRDEKDGERLASVAVGEVAVSLIFVDNYEDVMDAVEDSRKPLLLALIDRNINNFALSVDGIVKKFEKDKYIFVFDSRKLESIKVKKFDVLTNIREIEFGNKLPFTLSIGIGINGETLRQGMEYARAAIDLALGRGGDQALIKDGENYEFFGGNSKDVEINSSVRARVKAYALSEIIMESDSVIVMGHRNADLDCLGASIGVHKIATMLGKRCNIILNKTTSNINKMYNRLMESDEYKEGCFITSEEALEEIKPNTALIIVDVHRPSIMECPQIIDSAKKIVLIDHHRKGAEFVKSPVLTYHEPYASSASELVIEMMRYLYQKVILTNTEADALLAGITVDTKNFVIKTGAKTFEAAAYLKRAGADTVRVRLVMQNDMESYKAKALAVNSARKFGVNIAIAYCPQYVENPQLTNAQIADDMLNISGVEASFSLYFDHASEIVHISARSLGDINVQAIMEKLGGGGHQTASGAQVSSEDVEEVIEQLESCITAYLEKQRLKVQK